VSVKGFTIRVEAEKENNFFNLPFFGPDLADKNMMQPYKTLFINTT
jgi:hypothetical protein